MTNATIVLPRKMNDASEGEKAPLRGTPIPLQTEAISKKSICENLGENENTREHFHPAPVQHSRLNRFKGKNKNE